jgi:hypothetical protein
MKGHNLQKFYEPSGKFDPIRQSLLYVICIGIALFLGYLYAVLISFIPLIYLNIIILVGFGISLGLVCRVFVRFSHNRNRRSQLIHAIIFGILANYFQWTTYVLFLLEDSVPSLGLYFSNIDWIFTSGDFGNLIAEIYRNGAWEIFGIQINGPTLAIIWLVEFLLIVTIPAISVLQTKVYPYSELFEKWYEKYTLTKDFQSISWSNHLISNLESNPMEAIESLHLGISYRYTKIHLFYLKGEADHYLTFENIYFEGRGESTRKKSEIIVNNFRISDAIAKQILEKFPNKRERIEVL